MLQRYSSQPGGPQGAGGWREALVQRWTFYFRAIAFFNRRRVREEVRDSFTGSEGLRIYFMIFFRGSFWTLFSVGFLTGFGYPLAHLFRSKAGKTEVRNDLRRAWKRGPKKVWFLRGWNLEKWAPVEAGARFWGFDQVQKRAPFWGGFGTSFGSFWGLLA